MEPQLIAGTGTEASRFRCVQMANAIDLKGERVGNAARVLPRLNNAKDRTYVSFRGQMPGRGIELAMLPPTFLVVRIQRELEQIGGYFWGGSWSR